MNLNATIIGQTIAFILFVLFCMHYIWPPLMAAIEQRQKEITDGLALVERAKNDMKIAQNEAIDNLQQTKKAMQIVIEQANKRKAQIIAIAQTEAQNERNKIMAQTRKDIDIQMQRASKELRQQVAKLILLATEKIIERSVNQKNIANDIINNIITKL